MYEARELLCKIALHLGLVRMPIAVIESFPEPRKLDRFDLTFPFEVGAHGFDSFVTLFLLCEERSQGVSTAHVSNLHICASRPPFETRRCPNLGW